MIKINRSRCPKLLKTQRKNKTDYNKKKVVDALWEMQHKKCCYCEMRIPQQGHLKAVEHCRPKSVFNKLTNNWKNLLLACSQCNGQKSDKFPMQLCNNNNNPKVIWLKKDSKNRSVAKSGKPLLIDPSTPNIDPENEIDYILDDTQSDWGQIIHKTEKGKYTIKVINLSDPFHCIKRRDLYRRILYPALLNLTEAIDRGNQQEIKIKKDTIEDLFKSSSEYSGFARAFARYKKLDINYNIKIH